MDNSFLFYALSEPTRREIFEMLAREGELSASVISGRFKVSAPAISQHLKVLRDAELVTVQKQAQKRIYQINPQQLSVLEDWVEQMKILWSERYKRLDTVLQQLKIQKKINE
jgi:DNA-binding transcriptional ArsR family regulator